MTTHTSDGEPRGNAIDDTALRPFIERMTTLEIARREAVEDIGELTKEIKSSGLNAKIVKKLVREKLESADAKSKRDEEAAIEDLYRLAIGMR